MSRPEASAGTFDYVVIGAGSAGCVIARRLSEQDGVRVLVLEAGGPAHHPALHLPLGAGAVWNAPAYNWSYLSEPEAGLDNRRMPLPRGRVVGGSSAINMMAFVRGHGADFDAWAAQGLTDWSAEAVLPHFIRSESFAGPPHPHRGTQGPIRTSVADHRDPVCDALFQAARSHGIAENADYNALGREGIGRAQFNIGGGRRQSAWRSFLAPAVRSGKVSLRTGAHVEKILFDGTRACGVVFSQNRTRQVVHARRAVVLCAGAYNSPHLLMHSGIGPRAHLHSMGLTCFIDAPEVGANLQDHLRVSIEYERTQPSAMRDTLRLDRMALALAQATLLRTGPATQPLAAAQIFARTAPGLVQPDVQVLFRLFHPAMRPWFPLWRAPGIDGFGFVVCLTKPHSRGQLSLTSPDPLSPPRIEHRYLSHEADLQTLLRGIHLVRKLANSGQMRGHWTRELGPSDGCISDRELEEFVRGHAGTIFHPAGTCRMGVDARAVVSPRLAVQGTRQLYVADASVMPTLVSGNINATVLMIAEKAADYVAADT